jgi:hypothetical protein
MVHRVKGAVAKPIGIGKKTGWYGSPDFRIRSCDFVLANLPLIEENEDDIYEDKEVQEGDDGENDDLQEGDDGKQDEGTKYGSPYTDVGSSCSEVYFEGKKEVNFRKDISQLVTTAVVSSFTEHNLDSPRNCVVPTFWIDKKSFRICENDVLLLSQPKSLITKGTFSSTAMLILSLFVHHR